MIHALPKRTARLISSSYISSILIKIIISRGYRIWLCTWHWLCFHSTKSNAFVSWKTHRSISLCLRDSYFWINWRIKSRISLNKLYASSAIPRATHVPISSIIFCHVVFGKTWRGIFSYRIIPCILIKIRIYHITHFLLHNINSWLRVASASHCIWHFCWKISRP